jgi:hypothetical protein
LIFASTLVGALNLLITLPLAIRALLRIPPLRTPANMIAVQVAVLFLLAIIFASLRLYAAS